MHIKRLTSREIFSPSNKIHREVGRAKDLSAPPLLFNMNIVKIPPLAPSLNERRISPAFRVETLAVAVLDYVF